jgi:hypothetical protein
MRILVIYIGVLQHPLLASFASRAMSTGALYCHDFRLLLGSFLEKQWFYLLFCAWAERAGV